jgi:uncharacterized membrane protein
VNLPSRDDAIASIERRREPAGSSAGRRLSEVASPKRDEKLDDRGCDHRRMTEQIAQAAGDDADSAGLGESRWPPALALVLFTALNIGLRAWLPHEGAVRVPWLVPALEIALLVLLVASHPGDVARSRRFPRRVAVALVGALVAAGLWSTILLVYDLIRGTGVTQSATRLLATGAVIWLGNNLAFAMLYWLIDSGGPSARERGTVPVDFAFTQQLSPELAPPGWRPVFLDYLHLGFTNATAFSPTDVMPLTHLAKYMMLVQSTVALALFGLIVARAVNAFT